MPKRGNKILIVSLALLLALSVGYALFSDNITVSGTAVSDAEFDMVATCESGVSDLLTVNGFATGIVDKGYENDTCTASDNTVNVNVDFTYPGAQRTFTIKTTNKGNLDAKLNISNVKNQVAFCYPDEYGNVASPDVNRDLYNSFDSCAGGKNTNGWTSGNEYYIENSLSLITIEDENGNILSEAELSQFYDETSGILIIKPNYSTYFTSSISVEHEGESSNNKMDLKIATKVTLPFEQAPIQ